MTILNFKNLKTSYIKCVVGLSPNSPDCKMYFLEKSYTGNSTPAMIDALCAVGPTPYI